MIRNSYLMYADSYENPKQVVANPPGEPPGYRHSAGSVIENAIVDKNARIGKNVRIVNEAGIVESEESSYYVIRDKIVVIPKSTILPDGLVMEIRAVVSMEKLHLLTTGN